MAFWKNLSLAALGGGAVYGAWKYTAQRNEIRRRAGAAQGKRIVILGAGFGGRGAATELARLLPAEDNGEILLIDEDNFLLFTPMLTEAAGGELDPRHIAVPARNLPKRVRFMQGSVKAIDLASKTLTVTFGAGGLEQETTTIPADHLVIALGSVTNFHNIPGVAENSFQMKRLEDASAICDRVTACLERAAVEHDPAKRKALLTFVVAGGGYTGVETMAALNDLVREQVRQYGNASEADIRTVLVNPEERLLSETRPQLAEYAAQKLRDHGVDVRMKTRVKTADGEKVELEPADSIATHTLIWAAGVKPNPVVANLDCEKGKHGGVRVNADCAVLNRPGVWAIGDCAEIPNQTGSTYAPTAQNATREGATVARNIIASLQGQPTEQFRYKPIGELALVGRREGVAQVGGFNFSGLIAWAMWRAVYLAKMPGTAQKVRVLTDWLLDLVVGREPLALAPNAQNGARTRTTTTAQAAQA